MITSHRRLAGSMLALLPIFLASCASTEMGKTNMLLNASSYISDQRGAGTLPGIGKNEPGILQIDTVKSGRMPSGQSGAIDFVVVANKLGSASHYPVYRYELCKTSANSGWTIARAFRIDSKTASVELK